MLCSYVAVHFYLSIPFLNVPMAGAPHCLALLHIGKNREPVAPRWFLIKRSHQQHVDQMICWESSADSTDERLGFLHLTPLTSASTIAVQELHVLRDILPSNSSFTECLVSANTKESRAKQTWLKPAKSVTSCRNRGDAAFLVRNLILSLTKVFSIPAPAAGHLCDLPRGLALT